jgi:hypothetical protein
MGREWGGDGKEGKGGDQFTSNLGPRWTGSYHAKEGFQIINKPCMRGARYVRLIPWTLHSGSEQFIYNWKLEKEPGSGSRTLETAQRNGQEETGTKIYIYIKGI